MARTVFTGTAYADWLHQEAATTAIEVNTGAGNDGVFGSAFDDVIHGDDGNDLLWGNAGADTLTGDAGDDQVWGGEGADSIDGGTGNDLLWGDNGNDTVSGGEGNDMIWGGEGADSIDGGAGNDMAWGGNGNDSIALGDGNDMAWGEEGDDNLIAGTGNDMVWGGNGNDSVDGGAGDDNLYGEGGNDTLIGGDGNDMIFAGEGDDRIVAGNDADQVYAEGGNDIVIHTRGGAMGDVFDGGAGFDTLSFNMTRADWQNSTFQSQLGSYMAQIGSGHGGDFTFTTQGLTVRNFEAVSVTVDGVSTPLPGSNHGPVAVANFAKTNEDTALKIDLLGNDSDPDGDALTLVGTSASEWGAGIKLEGGMVVYDPTSSAKLQALGAGQTATDSFTYTVRDANGAETTQSATVTISGAAEKVEHTTIASFETGLDKGWQRTGDVSTVIGGTDGKKAAELSTQDAKDQNEVEGWLNLDKGALDKLGFGNAEEGSAVRGKVDLAQGQTLNFDWNFIGSTKSSDEAEKAHSSDFAFVAIRHDGDNLVTGLSSAKTMGEGHETGWQHFSFTAEEGGSYDIGIGVMDVGSSDGHSLLILDNVWLG